ncbi:hypothetical protein SCHPADRAFT_901453 [Schizopora paradoxa]|uniref:Uncharacterized protein n=1 Tax=Schizopora paradoxa TaxID=27342 RepID=A0A0H2RXL1_9AGAM|nr:hypothetical protein SCHPADRAFT_901453 [Schizopora paradoxa]
MTCPSHGKPVDEPGGFRSTSRLKKNDHTGILCAHCALFERRNSGSRAGWQQFEAEPHYERFGRSFSPSRYLFRLLPMTLSLGNACILFDDLACFLSGLINIKVRSQALGLSNITLKSQKTPPLFIRLSTRRTQSSAGFPRTTFVIPCYREGA